MSSDQFAHQAAAKFANRTKGPTTAEGYVSAVQEGKIAMFPSANPKDYQAFVCQRQGMPSPQMMLRFHAKDSVNSFAIEYAHQQTMTFARGPHDTKLVIEYYSGEEVTITGQHLEELYIALSEHKVLWCHAIDEFAAEGVGFHNPESECFEAKKPLIFGITIRRGKDQEPIVLASNDPFRMVADQQKTMFAN